jgi:hypothetical protein
MSNSSYIESAIRVSVYPSAWRAISGTLFAVSRASLPVILAVLVIETEPPVTEPLLVRLVLVFCLLPGLAAALIRHAFAVDVEIREAGVVSFYRRGRQVGVERSRITGISLWRLPLPGPGLTLWTAAPGGPSRAYLLHADNLDGLIDKISALGRTPSFIESSLSGDVCPGALCCRTCLLETSLFQIRHFSPSSRRYLFPTASIHHSRQCVRRIPESRA